MVWHHCVSCNREIADRDCIGLNRKLLSRKTTIFYCMDCLAENMECTVANLQEKIKEFKNQGCTLFQ